MPAVAVARRGLRRGWWVGDGRTGRKAEAGSRTIKRKMKRRGRRFEGGGLGLILVEGIVMVLISVSKKAPRVDGEVTMGKVMLCPPSCTSSADKPSQEKEEGLVLVTWWHVFVGLGKGV